MAVDAMGLEATGGGIVFSRGPDVEAAGNKEVEILMSVLQNLTSNFLIRSFKELWLCLKIASKMQVATLL